MSRKGSVEARSPSISWLSRYALQANASWDPWIALLALHPKVSIVSLAAQTTRDSSTSYVAGSTWYTHQTFFSLLTNNSKSAWETVTARKTRPSLLSRNSYKARKTQVSL